jgi:AraC-like DNA-binding protein
MGERLFLKLDEDAVQGPESDAPAETLHAHPVWPSLREAVSQILACHEQIPDGIAIEERVVPDGAVRLVLNFGDAPSAEGTTDGPIMVVGPRASPVVVRMCGRVDGLSIALRPGATEALLGVPAGELALRAIPLEDLWRGPAKTLLDRLADAPDDRARVALVQQALEQRSRDGLDASSRAAARAVRLIHAAAGRIAVRDLAARVGVGERRLQQLFHAHVGLSPRSLGRLARLHDCLRALRRARRRPAWASVAADHGFYDQAHLANEFRALCGLTPTAFLQHTVSGSSKTAP